MNPNQWKTRALKAEKLAERLQVKLNKSDFAVFDATMKSLNHNWQLKFDMIVKMFEAVTEQIKGNERHGRIIIESLRIGIDKFGTATNMRDTSKAIKDIREDAGLLVQWYDDIGYTGIHEWFKAWSADVNSIDNNADNAGQVMDKVIENHGFDFTPESMGIGWREMLNSKNK
jgi:hypothetical protein